MIENLHILVKADAQGRSIAVMENSRLVEFYQECGAEDSYVNAVFLGKVDRVMKGLDAAFVKIGQPKAGFLPIKEMESFAKTSKGEALAAGAELIVQVKKDAKGDKGAFVSRDIALPGQYIIYMPLNRHVGVSERVTDESERKALAETGRQLAGGAFGIVMRNAAAGQSEDALRNELETLKSRWTLITEKAEHAKAPELLYREDSLLSVLVRDYAPRYTLHITCNDRVNRMPAAPVGLLWEQIKNPELDALWAKHTIDEQVRTALSRHVPLHSGGTLTIDEREALTTIDVNSGSFTAKEDAAYQLNLSACAEIAAQIRLRNLSGIIIIDFVDMDTDEQRAQVAAALQNNLTRERQKTVIHGFTSLGLLEMTRKRMGIPLRDMLKEPCSVCAGTGYKRKGKHSLA
ncbi:MAG TPA: ribonuclease E/G [Candidatus Limiplasma sp.]|nr:ribonuclease E/G [Candidatus Limiplasma sp.]HRX09317.1 ribonuclease E/G [Candidatus Limiplasma sp.]